MKYTTAWLLSLCLCVSAAGQKTVVNSDEHWVATWATAQAIAPVAALGAPPPRPQAAPARPSPIGQIPETFKNQTVRMVARASIGGRRVRVQLSNALGNSRARHRSCSYRNSSERRRHRFRIGSRPHVRRKSFIYHSAGCVGCERSGGSGRSQVHGLGHLALPSRRYRLSHGASLGPPHDLYCERGRNRRCDVESVHD